jgi:hypothetical protein
MPRSRSGRRDAITRGKATLYAVRDALGRFVDIVKKGTTLARDRRRKAKTKAKSGYGHRGDRAA